MEYQRQGYPSQRGWVAGTGLLTFTASRTRDYTMCLLRWPDEHKLFAVERVSYDSPDAVFAGRHDVESASQIRNEQGIALVWITVPNRGVRNDIWFAHGVHEQQ